MSPGESGRTATSTAKTTDSRGPRGHLPPATPHLVPFAKRRAQSRAATLPSRRAWALPRLQNQISPHHPSPLACPQLLTGTWQTDTGGAFPEGKGTGKETASPSFCSTCLSACPRVSARRPGWRRTSGVCGETKPRPTLNVQREAGHSGAQNQPASDTTGPLSRQLRQARHTGGLQASVTWARHTGGLQAKSRGPISAPRV